MYIYIEGKEPVARKSKSLAEMGVKDGDNLIVPTEMKLPYNVYTDDDPDEGEGPNPADPTRFPGGIVGGDPNMVYRQPEPP